MGPGMAATFARYGFDTYLSDIKDDQLEKAKGTIDFVFKTLVGGGFLTADEAEAAKKRITLTTNQAEAVGKADFVVETVPERLEIKKAVFTELVKQAKPGVILASNTSGIPITTLQEGLDHPNRIVGMHWSNPPHLIPVIEVIKGAQTDGTTVETIKGIIGKIGMVAGIVDKDVPGFVENRILYAIMREALHLLDEGVASAQDIDTIAKWGIGYKLSVIGPLELLDVAGLDIYTAVASYLNKDLSNNTGISSTVTEKVEQGRLGLKTQGGLFDYTPEQIAELAQKRGRLLVATKKALMS
jgi:3-hydroxybutyryl-CoA dehydrogenase/5-formyl-3-hydroxy-2-methylpyridine 4-carboxylate dehydrogenase